VRNYWRGDLNTTVLLTASSADSKYNAMQRNITVVNADVYWPRNMLITPELLPLAGLNATLNGGTTFWLECPTVFCFGGPVLCWSLMQDAQWTS